MLSRILKGLLALALLAALLPALPAPAAAQANEQCFAETELCVYGRFLDYWRANGGLAVFGVPITTVRYETINGETIPVQWFERNRLELHPDNPTPYDVLLGRLGGTFVDRDGEPPPREQPRADCAYFNETGYNVCGDFLQYWRSNGLNLDGQPGFTAEESLALFGYPLTGEFEAVLADGNTYTVQWFERARFERHPENAPPFNVLLSRLGEAERGLPNAADVNAIKEAVWQYMETQTAIDNPRAAYTIRNVCIDERGFASAFLNPIDRQQNQGAFALSAKEGTSWTTRSVGSAFGPDAYAILGFPADFVCLPPAR